MHWNWDPAVPDTEPHPIAAAGPRLPWCVISFV